MNDAASPSEEPRVPLGGDYWEAEPAAPLWGFADLHAHLMAHLAFGGGAFWGQPHDPNHQGPEGIEYALSSCEPIHGGLLNINPELGHLASGAGLILLCGRASPRSSISRLTSIGSTVPTREDCG